MPATPAVRARLYRESLGWCAIPDCYTELRLDGKGTRYIAKAAHIVGEHEGSARHDASLSLEARNSIENLILLCPTHHDVVDADEATWTVTRLQRLKAEHEERMYNLLLSGRSWRQKFIMLDYVNIPRVSGMPGGALLHRACREAGLTGDMTLRGLGYSLGIVEGAARSLLAQWDARAFPIDRIDLSHKQDLAGPIVSFDVTAYTKNGPNPSAPVPLTGNLKVDPHIWFKLAERKVYVRYDPSWVTTSTAFGNLNQGRKICRNRRNRVR